MPDRRKYEFSWELLGNIDTGRPNLGRLTRLENYRLMQFTFRDVLEKKYGTEEADRLFYDAGLMAGSEFYLHFLTGTDTFNHFIKRMEDVLQEMKIGILRVEKADLEQGSFVVTVSEDLDCSGLPELDYEICKYDEGFIAGILENYTGSKFNVKEIDCWCTGERTCRFKAEINRGND